MRPNIQIPHTLNGRVRDYAAREGMSTPEAYDEIIRAGLEVKQNEQRDALDKRDELTQRVAGLDWSDVEVNKRPDRVQAVVASYRWLQERDKGKRSQFQSEVFPEYDAGLEKDTWWRAVTTVLRQLDDVNAPVKGGAWWSVGDE